MANLQSLLAESLQLMLIGMSSVFIILSLLIVLITLISRVLPEEDLSDAMPTMRKRNIGAVPKTNNDEVIAAITVAVNTFKKNNTSN